MNILYQEISQRNTGLDIFRSLAIIIVVVSHFSEFFLKFNIAAFLPNGVDMFFVLSGFLIGNLFLKAKIRDKTSLIKYSINFYIRRWFRTLPNYYLFLVINILLVYTGICNGILNTKTFYYFIFLQNFIKPLDLFFWESWSLAVEEWFYLMLPMLFTIIIVVSNRNFKNVYLIAVAILIVFPLVYRILNYNPNADQTYYYLYFKKIVLSRLDTIAYGLLMAFLIKENESIFSKTKRTSFLISICGLFLLKYIDADWNSYFKQTFALSIESILTAMLLPAFYFLKTKSAFIKKTFSYIAIISYSLYLVHLPVIYIMRKYFAFNSEIIQTLIYLTAVIAIATINYILWERPTTRLRENFK